MTCPSNFNLFAVTRREKRPKWVSTILALAIITIDAVFLLLSAKRRLQGVRGWWKMRKFKFFWQLNCTFWSDGLKFIIFFGEKWRNSWTKPRTKPLVTRHSRMQIAHSRNPTHRPLWRSHRMIHYISVVWRHCTLQWPFEWFLSPTICHLRHSAHRSIYHWHGLHRITRLN